MPDTKRRILIVDDEPDLLAVLRFALEADGFDVIEATDGERGLELAWRESPDLMVLDLMLPRMDGYKVCRALKFDERYRRIVIVILSARTGETDKRLAFDLGADAFVTKPYDVKSLIREIRSRLGMTESSAAA
ncbi:MAG TPA: response regulator [Candidatus Acidoferrales bacterium]|nr:response regulator [Candidatus Acidoferrales bacterium]